VQFGSDHGHQEEAIADTRLRHNSRNTPHKQNSRRDLQLSKGVKINIENNAVATYKCGNERRSDESKQRVQQFEQGHGLGDEQRLTNGIKEFVDGLLLAQVQSNKDQRNGPHNTRYGVVGHEIPFNQRVFLLFSCISMIIQGCCRKRS
jgi:hypothetical protein